MIDVGPDEGNDSEGYICSFAILFCFVFVNLKQHEFDLTWHTSVQYRHLGAQQNATRSSGTELRYVGLYLQDHTESTTDNKPVTLVTIIYYTGNEAISSNCNDSEIPDVSCDQLDADEILD